MNAKDFCIWWEEVVVEELAHAKHHLRRIDNIQRNGCVAIEVIHEIDQLIGGATEPAEVVIIEQQPMVILIMIEVARTIRVGKGLRKSPH